MEFVIYAIDKPGDGEARRKARIPHLQCVVEHQEKFIYGGPLLAEDGTVRGSLLVMRFADRAALDAYLAQDPYFSAGVFESVTIWTSRQVVPERGAGQLQGELDRQHAIDAALR